MSLNKKFASLLLVSTISTICSVPAAFADHHEVGNAPLSIDEIKAKRKETREELMVPSLDGIRGIAYRVVGYKDFEPLESILGGKLKEAGVPLFLATKLKGGEEPVDAILQISFFKTTSHTIADLTVTQWVSLLRDPKAKVRAVTYSDKVFIASHNPKEAVEQLSQDFVNDFLRANSKSTDKGKKESREASVSKKETKVTKKSSK
ncbi:MAG: hypothetical protein IAF58_07970 [Leptolyngbya sp.]|nr:hypothetical protein [Candidatus Melainabacteria bacterium]